MTAPRPPQIGDHCHFPRCDQPSICLANGILMCLDHVDWGMALAVGPAARAIAAALAAVRTKDPAGSSMFVERLLADASELLRLAGVYALGADRALAESCDAVALQAEDLARVAPARLGGRRTE